MSKNSSKSGQQETTFDKEYKSREYDCPVCGKHFYIPMYVSLPKYAYVLGVYDPKSKKTKQQKCCGYSCYRKGLQKQK